VEILGKEGSRKKQKTKLKTREGIINQERVKVRE
jgi:hypothetical protein